MVVLQVLDWLVVLVARLGFSERFVRFGIVGVFGFCWDTATVYATRGFAGIYLAGVLGFLVSASANWALNRVWTFRGQVHVAPHIQWARFMAANAVGFVFNRGTFFILVTISPLCRQNPVIAISAGAIFGLAFNYFLSKKLVFR